MPVPNIVDDPAAKAWLARAAVLRESAAEIAREASRGARSAFKVTTAGPSVSSLGKRLDSLEFAAVTKIERVAEQQALELAKLYETYADLHQRMAVVERSFEAERADAERRGHIH